MDDSPAAPQLETAHVLFMDIVGYSHREMAAQRRLLEELQERVRQTGEFQRVEASGELLRLPTGDGMALVFFRDPVAPVRCAMQLSEALQTHPELKLRMGLHTGPVYRVRDINANINVSGGGINFAQRVMDCGDAGHILLSNAIWEYLRQVGTWPVQDLGECQVKHEERLHLYNLFTAEVGNPAVPEKLRKPYGRFGVSDGKRDSGADTATRPYAHTPTQSPAGLRVALLYKRNTEPDGRLLLELERRLNERGYRVFVDRHLEVGMKWAEEIDRQIRTADAVIPLLSEASIQSEMLAHEVQIAHETAQQRGRPRLLPVRVNYTGPLPEGLAVVLEPLEYALWETPADDERVAGQLQSALQNPAPPAPEAVRAKLEPVGGAVALDSAFYVVRPADEEFRAAIARRDSIVLVKGARQMGKTSLLARGLQQAREAGARVVRTDFQKLNQQHLESADALFMKLADTVADQLDLETLPDETWHPRRGPSENFERYWQRVALRQVEAPIVWGLDEVDRLFTTEYASEVFGLFRSWHNERALDPEGPWRRLTLAIAYATEAHLFITDVNQSPFNVGTRLTLEDFTFEQVADLNERHGSPLRDEAELARYVRLVGGQPYLVRRGLHEMVSHGLDLPTFERQADRDEGIFGDHLRRILVLLARNPELCDVVRMILRGQPCPTQESFYRLRSAGVMGGDSARDVRPRCRLYATYLERHLLG
jgi:class 3 adenylate cyclase